MGRMRSVIVVPTYNEAESVVPMLDRLTSLGESTSVDLPDVLVVDDSSPDGTGELVKSHPAYAERIHLLTRTSKDGLGAAYRAGFRAALDSGYDAVVQMDADGSHPTDAVLPMLGKLAVNDLVIGSRYVPGGATENWPMQRKFISWGANTYARTVLRLKTHDATAGFRAWRSDALVDAGVLDTQSNGYGFQVENTWHAERLGFRIAEHPITFVERVHGASKMTGDVAIEAARLILKWRWQEITGRSKVPTRAGGPAA